MNTDIEVLVGDRSTGKTQALVNDVLSRSGVYTRVVLCPDGARRDVVTERLIMRGCRRVSSRPVKLESPGGIVIRVLVPDRDGSNLRGFWHPVWVDDMHDSDDPFQYGLNIVFGTALACRPWLEVEANEARRVASLRAKPADPPLPFDPAHYEYQAMTHLLASDQAGGIPDRVAATQAHATLALALRMKGNAGG